MKRYFLILLLITSYQTRAQVTDSTQTDLLNDLNNVKSDSPDLLPEHMLFTQWPFWSKRGIMRQMDYFELTPEKRQRELRIRRTMLIGHQVAGFVTLGGMIAQGVVGMMLYNGNGSVKGLHESLATTVNITYCTTASFSLFAPPRAVAERKGYSSIKLHKILAIIHASGMIATNLLAETAGESTQGKIYHRAAAFTTFAAFAASIIVIKF